MNETQQLLSELARARALFQARTVALVLGAEPPITLPHAEPLPSEDKDQ